MIRPQTLEANNEYRNELLWSGFDYDRQVWLRAGRYLDCGHLDACECFGRRHAGAPAGEYERARKLDDLVDTSQHRAAYFSNYGRGNPQADWCNECGERHGAPYCETPAAV